MGMTIIQATMEPDEVKAGNFILETQIKESVTDPKVTIALCDAYSTDRSLIEQSIFASKETVLTGKTASVSFERSVCKDRFIMYLVLKDVNGIFSNMVQLFVNQPQIALYQIEEDGERLRVFFHMDRADSVLANQMEMLLGGSVAERPLTDWKINLKAYHLFEKEGVEAECRLFSVNSGANVWSLPTSLTFLSAPPKIDAVTYESSQKLVIQGGFASTGRIYACLYGNGKLLRDSELTSTNTSIYEWDLSELHLDPSNEYDVACSNKNDLGKSRPTRRWPVVLERPDVSACSFDGNAVRLHMVKEACYLVEFDGSTAIHSGRTVQLDSVPKNTVSLRVCRDGAYGPLLELKPERPAYYTFTSSQVPASYYGYSERPFIEEPTKDMEVALEDEVGVYTKGEYFKIEDNELDKLVISKSLIGADMQKVHEEYDDLLHIAATEFEKKAAVKNAITRYLPMRAEEFLFYHYGYHPEEGFVDLCPGMCLFVEYAVYQNIPDGNMAARGSEKKGDSVYNADLSGFVGTGTAQYQIIMRNNKISFEPFVKTITDHGGFHVPPPPDILGDNHLCGGAGVCDLLFAGLSAPFVRLVYPKSHTERNTTGRLDYVDNVCILAADRLNLLNDATIRMRERQYPLDGVAYSDFRGRVSVIPKIRITVDGHPIWVSLGTTFQDVLTEFGMEKGKTAALRRAYRDGYYPVEVSESYELPLLIGDRLKVV